MNAGELKEAIDRANRKDGRVIQQRIVRRMNEGQMIDLLCDRAGELLERLPATGETREQVAALRQAVTICRRQRGR